MKRLFLCLLCIPVFTYANVWPQFHNTGDREGIAMRYGPNCCDTVCSADIEYSHASPVIDGTRSVYIQGAEKATLGGKWFLWKVDADNCSIKWSLLLAGTKPISSPQATCAISGDTMVYVCNINDTCLWAVRADGTVKWKYKFINKQPAQASPVLNSDGSVIYSLTNRGVLYAINSDSTLKWRDSLPNLMPSGECSSPAIGPNGRIYVGASNDRLYAIDSADGSIEWSYQANSDIYTTPAVCGDTVYFGTSNAMSNIGRLYAVVDNGASASLKWSCPLGRDVTSSPAVDAARGIVYCGSDSSTFNKLCAVNMSTGVMKWFVQLNGAPGISSPAIAYSNNMIYIGDEATYIYVIENMNDSGRIVCSREHDWEITSPAVDIDTSIWYNEYSKALHKLKCWIPPAGAEERGCVRKGVYLSESSPNPFAKETQISFTISEESPINLSVYDLSGRLVKELVNGNYTSGTYTIKWNGKNSKGDRVKVGVYLYKLKAKTTELSKKMTVIAN